MTEDRSVSIVMAIICLVYRGVVFLFRSCQSQTGLSLSPLSDVGVKFGCTIVANLEEDFAFHSVTNLHTT